MSSGKPAQIDVAVGTVFLGKYRVEAILGSGGMGIVALCTHLALNERVAIKMLRSDVLRDAESVERFTREAQAAAKLKSEYVARVTDVGRFETGVPYMVMEYLDGLDLDRLVHERGNVTSAWGVELVLQAAEALAEAHSIGIVHRDVKPSNLFVTWRPDGSPLVKVLDFGISKSSMGTDMQLTQTQSLLGTPAYMSPEQMRSARLVDARTDIWSLGTVLYEILEGRKPFEADSFSEMCVKVAVDAPMPMANTPLGLQAVILRCLAKQPEQRYASMAELGRDLVPYAKDPHGAQVMVDRMTRMFRRSVGDWDTSPNATPPPPAPLPLPLPQEVPQVAIPAEGYRPSYPTYPQAQQQLIETHPVGRTTRRSRAPWILLIAVATALGVTVGFLATRGVTEREPAKATLTTPTPPPPPTPIPAPTPPPIADPIADPTPVPVATPDDPPPPVAIKKKASPRKVSPKSPPPTGLDAPAVPPLPPAPPKPVIDPFSDRLGTPKH